MSLGKNNQVTHSSIQCIFPLNKNLERFVVFSTNNHLLCLGHNGDVKSTRIRSNGINSSATGTLLSDKHKLGTNNYKYYSDLSEISGGILGTIPEKVSLYIMASFDRISCTTLVKNHLYVIIQ